MSDITSEELATKLAEHEAECAAYRETVKGQLTTIETQVNAVAKTQETTNGYIQTLLGAVVGKEGNDTAAKRNTIAIYAAIIAGTAGIAVPLIKLAFFS